MDANLHKIIDKDSGTLFLDEKIVVHPYVRKQELLQSSATTSSAFKSSLGDHVFFLWDIYDMSALKLPKVSLKLELQFYKDVLSHAIVDAWELSLDGSRADYGWYPGEVRRNQLHEQFLRAFRKSLCPCLTAWFPVLSSG